MLGLPVAQPGAEDTGVEVTMAPRSTILLGPTMGRMVMLSGLTDREQQRGGAEIPSPGIATNSSVFFVAILISRLVSVDSSASLREKPASTTDSSISQSENELLLATIFTL